MSCIEIGERGRTVVVGATNGERIGFILISIENGLKVLNSLELPDIGFGRPFKIRRMVGTEYYIVGCVKHLVALKVLSGRVIHLRSFKDVHEDFISDLHIIRNIIFSKAKNEAFFRVTTIGDQQATSLSQRQQPKPAGPSSPPPVTDAPLTAKASNVDIPLCSHR